MKTALQRQLARTWWQVVGFAVPCLALAIGVLFWGTHIESEVGEVAKHQRQDHRRIVAVERGHPLGRSRIQNAERGGGDALQSPSPAHQQPSPPSSGHQGHGTDMPSQPNAPSVPGQTFPVGQPVPSLPLPAHASPNAEPPGLLDPTVGAADHAVEQVCSAADQLAHLC